MKEIGGFLEYKKEFFDVENEKQPNLTYFNSGREALRYLVLVSKITTLYLPSYFCDDVLEYLRNISNLKIKTYPVDDKFRVVTNILDTIQTGDKGQVGFLIVDFFGRRDPEYNFISKRLKKNGIIMFIDRTHSALNSYENSSVAEFTSIRKLFVNLPGAYVKCGKYRGEYKKLSMTSSFALFRLKGKYIENHSQSLKNEFRKKELAEEKKYSNFPKTLCAIRAPQLEAILCRANINKMRKARQRNYNILLRNFDPSANIAWHSLGYRKNEAPAFALVKCYNYEIREKLKAYLIENGIYPPVHWINGTDLSRLLLSLPVDHRYSQKDMLFVALVINNFRLAKL